MESSCCRNLSCFCRKRKDASSCIPTEKIPYTVEKCIKMLICCQKVLLDGGLLYFFWKTGLMQNPLEKAALILRLHRLSWQRLRGVQCVGGILIKILLSTTWRPVMEGKEGKKMNTYVLHCPSKFCAGGLRIVPAQWWRKWSWQRLPVGQYAAGESWPSGWRLTPLASLDWVIRSINFYYCRAKDK